MKPVGKLSATFLIAAARLLAQSALLECTQDAAAGGQGRDKEMKGAILLSFRASAIPGWTVDRGQLLLRKRGHTAASVKVAAVREPWTEAKPPKSLKLDWVDAPVEEQPEGWVLIRIPGAVVQPMAADQRRGIAVKLPPDWRVDSRESIRYAPYLYVEGRR